MGSITRKASGNGSALSAGKNTPKADASVPWTMTKEEFGVKTQIRPAYSDQGDENKGLKITKYTGAMAIAQLITPSKAGKKKGKNAKK